jgi:polysaccharide pyruvyl transferase WcaK-like protein
MDPRDPRDGFNENVEVFDTNGTVADLLRELSRCSFFIGQRLHSVVLAHACNIPALALQYRPKVADYMSSLGMAEWSLSTADVSLNTLIDRCDEIEQKNAVIRSQLTKAIGERVRVLESICESVRDDSAD